MRKRKIWSDESNLAAALKILATPSRYGVSAVFRRQPEVSDMVERVARAICRAHTAELGNETDETWDDWTAEARAAIEAMREPTEVMQLAGHKVRIEPVSGLPTSCGTDEIYTAMIDAALTGDNHG